MRQFIREFKKWLLLMSEAEPVYYDPNYEDPLEKAKKKYIGSKKGRAALKRYFDSDKGKKALKKARSRHYEQKVKPEAKLAEACTTFLKNNPSKTVEDFLKEVI